MNAYYTCGLLLHELKHLAMATLRSLLFNLRIPNAVLMSEGITVCELAHKAIETVVLQFRADR